MFAPKEIVQNLLMGLPPVAAAVRKFHCTGINRDEQKVRQAYAFFRSHGDVAGRSVLELGPGQTLEVLELARRDAANRCCAVDIVRYIPSRRAEAMGIEYRIYDGRRIPFDEASFDRVWAMDVLEHVRHPELTVAEVRRVLRPGGLLVCRVDLRDHYHLQDPCRWLECLKYPRRLWNAMTWNRSSYVNRLRYSQWQEMFGHVGLEPVQISTQSSDELAARYARLKGYRADDLRIWQFEGAWRR